MIDQFAWMADAKCAGSDPDLFFPERGDKFAHHAAKAVCGECPVSSACLEYALELATTTVFPVVGIFGGMSEKDRSRIRRERRLSAAS